MKRVWKNAAIVENGRGWGVELDGKPLRTPAREPITVPTLMLAKGIAEASVFPVLCGSATKLIGVDRLTSFLTHEGPAPEAEDGQPVTFVFKTIVDPYVGRVNLFKVLQGTIKTDASLVNGRSGSDERLHQLLERQIQVGKEAAHGSDGC